MMEVFTFDPGSNRVPIAIEHNNNKENNAIADKVDNLITQTECSGYQTHYVYDDKHRLIQSEDAEGYTTRYYYNYTKAHLERLLSQVTYPDDSYIQMDYDEKARLISYGSSNQAA